MPKVQLPDPSGVTDFTERVQHPRAPLSWMELSRTDAVADYFRAQGREPNYDEIAGMVTPYKYVNANFRIYPLILGEKEGTAKIRLVADASQLHLGIERSRDGEQQRGCGFDADLHWFGPAFRAIFRVGAEYALPDAAPKWLRGPLPVAQYRWVRDGVRYTLDLFGALLPATTECLCAWVRVGMERLRPDAVAQWTLEMKGETPLVREGDYLVHGGNRAVRAGFSADWTFDEEEQLLTWRLPADREKGAACAILADRPIDGTLIEWPSSAPRWAIDEEKTRLDAGMWLADWAQPAQWQARLDDYVQSWKRTFAAGAQVSVPEMKVQQAHKGVRTAGFLIANRDQMNYGVHNQYERSYTDESGTCAMTLAHWGHLEESRRYLEHLAFYTQKGLATHEFGVRLHHFCRLYALTRDDRFLARNLPRMRRWCEWLINDLREEQHGLGTPNNHCGDLHHQVYSLSANSLAWRGIRDFGLLTGDEALLDRAARYRADIRRAAAATLDAAADPPYLPMALYSDEPTPDTLTGTTLSSYWCLMAPYALYGGALGDGHPGTRAIVETFLRRGGLCAGLVRWTPQDDYNTMTILRECGIDDLYGAKLVHAFARLDDPDQLVLALYGKLGLGLTPDTYISGEGCSLVPSRVFDPEGNDGRSMYLPPISSSQLLFALILRDCLVFDLDSRDDGRDDTLRLAFATPRRWLAEGQKIAVKKMPTVFGPVSYTIHSRIDSAREITAEVTLPQRNPPTHCHLRLRAPEGRTMRQVLVNGQPHAAFDAGSGTIDLSGAAGKVRIVAGY